MSKQKAFEQFILSRTTLSIERDHGDPGMYRHAQTDEAWRVWRAAVEYMTPRCDCSTSIDPEGVRRTICSSMQMRRAVAEGHAFMLARDFEGKPEGST
ncbi:MAG: hypothetical protein ACRCYZ_06770 [Alphaproteobacteria bacterium]